MDGAICKFVRGNKVPKIDITPLSGGGVSAEHGAILVVCPARIKEIIADVAVRAIADQDGLIDKDHVWKDGHACIENIKSKRIIQGSQFMKILAWLKIDLRMFVIFWIDLI